MNFIAKQVLKTSGPLCVMCYTSVNAISVNLCWFSACSAESSAAAVSESCLSAVAYIAYFDSVNSTTFKDLWNEIQGLSSTGPVFKYFQGLEFRRKKFKDFQGCMGTLKINMHAVYLQWPINDIICLGREAVKYVCQYLNVLNKDHTRIYNLLHFVLDIRFICTIHTYENHFRNARHIQQTVFLLME